MNPTNSPRLGEWITGIYAKYGLGENPTQAEIDAKAIELLSNGPTLLPAIELIAGRRVDANEIENAAVSIPLITLYSLDIEHRLTVLKEYLSVVGITEG